MFTIKLENGSWRALEHPKIPMEYFQQPNFAAIVLDEVELWHEHLNLRDLYKISKKEVIVGLPKLLKVMKMVCGPCQEGKQTSAQHKKIKEVLTSRPLELLHIDLMGPTQAENLGGKKYIMVIVDDFLKIHLDYPPNGKI